MNDSMQQADLVNSKGKILLTDKSSRPNRPRLLEKIPEK